MIERLLLWPEPRTPGKALSKQQAPIPHSSSTDPMGSRTAAPLTLPIPADTYWFVEIWLENRAIFKILVADFLMYSLVLFFFSASHSLIAFLVVNNEMKTMLESAHFWFTLALLFVFSTVLLIEISVYTYNRLTK